MAHSGYSTGGVTFPSQQRFHTDTHGQSDTDTHRSNSLRGRTSGTSAVRSTGADQDCPPLRGRGCLAAAGCRPLPPLLTAGWKPSASQAGAAAAARRGSDGGWAEASPVESVSAAQISGSSPTRSRRSARFLMTRVGLSFCSLIFMRQLSVHAACSLPRRFS